MLIFADVMAWPVKLKSKTALPPCACSGGILSPDCKKLPRQYHVHRLVGSLIVTRLRTETCSREETADPMTDLGWLLVTARCCLLAALDRELAPLDLTAAQCAVLLSLARGVAATPAALCDLLDYDRGAMTRLLDRMEAKELLVRMPNPEDRRGVLLEITDKGRVLAPQVQPKIDTVYRKALRNLDPAQAKMLVSMLCRVVHNLDPSER